LRRMPAGVPSTTTPRAGPCDSPHVISRKILPKLLPIALRSRLVPPCPEEAIVEIGGAAEAEALVEPLRAPVGTLRAEADVPRALPAHGLDDQSQGRTAIALPLPLRRHRDAVEMRPAGIER